MKIIPVKAIILFFIFFSSSVLSQYNNSYNDFDIDPIILNPALSGDFEGITRLGLVLNTRKYEKDFRKINSLGFNIDGTVLRGFKPIDKISIGLSIQHNKRYFKNSDNSFTTNIYSLSFSYQFTFTKNNKLSLGVRIGKPYIQSTLIYLVTPKSIQEYLDNNGYKWERPSKSNKKSGKLVYSIGTTYKLIISKTNLITLGLTLSSIEFKSNRIKDFTFFERYYLNSFVKNKFQIRNNLFLKSKIYYQYIFKSNFISAQFLIGSNFQKHKHIIISGGIGITNQKNVLLLFNTDLKKLKLSISYQFNQYKDAKQLVQTTKNKSFELGIRYIFKDKKLIKE